MARTIKQSERIGDLRSNRSVLFIGGLHGNAFDSDPYAYDNNFKEILRGGLA